MMTRFQGDRFVIKMSRKSIRFQFSIICIVLKIDNEKK